MDRNQIVEAIKNAARTLGVERLTKSQFREQSGISQAAVLKHFDFWSEACNAAGLRCGEPRLVPTPRISTEDCIAELRRVAQIVGREALSSKEFDHYARFSSKPVSARFGSWAAALKIAGLKPTELSQKAVRLSEDECVREMRRVAEILGTTSLSHDEFNAHARFTDYRVTRACGTWAAALEKAGLGSSPNYNAPTSIANLAILFLEVTTSLNRLPTLVQLVRRSRHAADTFSRNRGGYNSFKRQAIEYLFSAGGRIRPRNVRAILEEELSRLQAHVSATTGQEANPKQHYQGRTLNFRAFMYAPTSEHDVEGMFCAIAHDLGFEIIGNRSEFPDCEARRKVKADRERWEKCLIEYEFSSRDYKKHKHPIVGCDLIVCWQHNWDDCPIEVLVLENAIKKLDGWR